MVKNFQLSIPLLKAMVTECLFNLFLEVLSYNELEYKLDKIIGI